MNALSALETFYAQQGILSTAFTCVHQQQCSRGAVKFTGPKSAFVSTGYEITRPRLLFLSLDSGSGEETPEKRLPAAVRRYQEVERDFSLLAKNKHWYRTHELAWYILRRFHSELQLSNTRTLFAHANAAKCCMNKDQRKKADALLFRNCRRYLEEELAILRPDILITQGDEAKLAVEKLERLDPIDIEPPFVKVVTLDSRRTFWLHTYHPNCWGKFHKQRAFNNCTKVAEGWERYAEHAYRFMHDA